MKHITLDCTLMTDPDSLHDLFAQALEFPADYGRNLDALYSTLRTYPALELTLENASAIGKMFRYGDNLLLAIQDATKDNPELTVLLQD